MRLECSFLPSQTQVCTSADRDPDLAEGTLSALDNDRQLMLDYVVLANDLVMYSSLLSQPVGFDLRKLLLRLRRMTLDCCAGDLDKPLDVLSGDVQRQCQDKSTEIPHLEQFKCQRR